MTLELYLEYFIATSVFSLVPGPTIMLVIHYALIYGKGAGKYTIPAVIVGDAIAILFAFIGIGALMKIVPQAFYFMKIAGGMYLIYLGLTSIFTKHNIEDEKVVCKKKAKNIFKHVVTVTALNPKSIVFFMAFLPQFIDPKSNYTGQLIILAAIFVILGTLYCTIYNFLASSVQKFFENESSLNKVYTISGCILVLLGITTFYL